MIIPFAGIRRNFVSAAFVMLFTVFFAMTTDSVADPGQERRGAWVDEIIVMAEPSARRALTLIDAGEADLYAFGISDPSLYEQIADSEDLEYEQHVGTSAELAFNPAGPVFEGTGELNPFAVPRIREAMNWLVDRDHITGEIYGGRAKPRYLPINSAFVDYARYVDVVRRLEQRYQYNPERAVEVISEEMENLGAEKKDGTWHYNGEEVEIRFLIRSEDERRDIGDYVATELENNAGFSVERDYRTAEEASPVWSGADPAEGRFHIYTGGWISTVVSRDEATAFNFYYTPRGLSAPLWQAFQPTEEFDEVAERLGRRDYSSIEERSELFAHALELSLKDSTRIWLVDQVSVSPRRKDISVAADLSGGIAGAYLWPYTLRFDDRVGGRVRIATQDVLDDPWNPLDGSNWIFDMMFTRSTSDYGTIVDPYTGLHLPQRIDRAEVTVQEGLPVERTHDWVSLEFSEEEIKVPEDAWIDWDGSEQRFIEVGDKHPEGLTARRKSVAYYPEELYQTKWHDGSSFSLADTVMNMILTFDRASEESRLFDESKLPSFESFQQHFRGVRIRSKSPLVIETYSDQYSLDAENNVTTWYPNYAHGPGAWHTLAVGMKAEKAEELAFSNYKADMLEVDWMNMIAGPSIVILRQKLEEAVEQNYIPYESVLEDYIDSEDASERWRNLKNWHEQKGHFWVGIGPFYLERVYPVQKNVHLKRFEDYPDAADKWERYEEPMMPEVEVSGPGRLRRGEVGEFAIEISFEDSPYPAEALKNVKFLWFDEGDNLVRQDDAELVDGSTYRITLSEQETAGLNPGPNRIEVSVVSNLVSIPVFEEKEFMVLP